MQEINAIKDAPIPTAPLKTYRVVSAVLTDRLYLTATLQEALARFTAAHPDVEICQVREEPGGLTPFAKDLADRALNEAIAYMQNELGIESGDFAAQFFQGYDNERPIEIFARYVQSELVQGMVK